MAITSDDINNQYFSIDRKGYDVDEVDVFLEHMVQEVDSFNSQIEKLKQDLQAATEASNSTAYKDEIELKLKAKDKEIQVLKDKLAEAGKDDSAIAQALIVAQRSADTILSDAKKDKEKIIREAQVQAKKIIANAEEEKRKINLTILDLQTRSNKTQEEYKKILNNIISDTKKSLENIQKTPIFSKVNGSKHSKNSSSQSSSTMALSHSSLAKSSVSSAVDVTRATVAPQASPSKVKDMSGFGDASDDLSMDLD